MAWFGNRARRGLTNRAYERIAGEHGPGPASLMLAVGIAASVYPDAIYGTEECDQFNALLPRPKVNPKDAARVTESYVDHRSITLSSCMLKLYGTNQDEFVAAAFGATSGDEESHPANDDREPTRLPCRDATIDDAFSAVCDEYATFTTDDPVGKQQLAAINESLRERYASQPRVLSPSAEYCIDRFTNSELDFTTPDLRGLGRMTENIPRFAAKHRSEFLEMSADLLGQMRFAIKRHIICAHLFMEFMHEMPIVDDSRYDETTLFEKWIPLIYQPPVHLQPDSTDENDIYGVWFAATGRSIRDLACQAGIRWTSIQTAGADQAIITHYFDAGKTLRFAEAVLLND